ncbi:MAG: DEAD/DEAH box helicase [Lentisphaerae bacterium]|nr:DEAD/DEAH box helicase [Lentisphaerota bacterium]
MKLRSYQHAAVRAIEAEWRDHRSTLLILPTGCGKTLVFSEIIRRAFPRRALVLAHREELVFQAREKVETMTGWRVDIEMGESRAEMACMFGGPRVVVSTVQTQASGGDGGGRMTRFDPRLFGVVVVDEGHHSTSATYRRVLDWYTGGNPDLRVVGVTATPDRADEEALGQVYETVAYDYEIADAIQDGWLVPITQQMVHVEGLDFSSCRSNHGDLNGGDLAKVMEYEENLHRVVSPAIEIAGDRRTLVFAASVAHAERMAEMFNRHRPDMAAWVCGKTPRDDRRKTLAAFAAGRVQVVCNCGVLTEGFDNPGVEVVIMARPTKSRSLYAQMAGRATRPADAIAHDLNDHESPEARRALIEASSKPSCLIVDFVGNSGKHKLCTSLDILGGKVSEQTRQLALKRLQTGGPVRVDEALLAAAAQEEEERQRQAARRARLTARASWTAQTVNPFDTLDLQPVAQRGWDRGKRLTDKQAALLRKQGIDPDAVPYHHARQLLNELFRRWDEGLCTFGQAKILRKRGLPTNITREEATKQIDAIAAREGWKKPEVAA